MNKKDGSQKKIVSTDPKYEIFVSFDNSFRLFFKIDAKFEPKTLQLFLTCKFQLKWAKNICLSGLEKYTISLTNPNVDQTPLIKLLKSKMYLEAVAHTTEQTYF